MPYHNEIPRSLPLLVARREIGQFHQRQSNAYGFGCSTSFVHSVSKQLAPQSMTQNPQLESPSSLHQTNTRQKPATIRSLHVDRVENRFVLAGGSDAVVSVYDLSKWGQEDYLESRKGRSNRCSNKDKSVHKPIASSQREPPRSFAISSDYESNTRALEIPSGHAAPITKVEWYPVDSGAFLSSSRDGSLLVWDTESLSPVALCTPFDSKGIGNFHLSPRRIHSVVVASWNDPCLKLVDIRSGASSHTLLGHTNRGVSSVQWAPHNDFLLASGGLDGTVRLWDIRKPGSRSCVTILDQDTTQPPARGKPYNADYSHLPKPSAAILASVDDAFSAAAVSSESHTSKGSSNGTRIGNARRKIAINNQHVAPNNYRPTENSSVLSHSGPVSALSFGAEQDGHCIVSTGQDGNIHVWDLRGNGHLLPLRFMAPGQQPAVSRSKKQVPLLLTRFGRFGSSTMGNSALGGCCWVGNGSNLLGFSLQRGGMPQQVLQGHLHDITAMDAIEASMQVITAGGDGMILTWGKPDRTQTSRKRAYDEDSW